VIVEAVDSSPQGSRRYPRHAATPVRAPVRALVGALALIAFLVPLQRWWAAQVLLVPLLLIIPGVILLRTLRVPGQVASSFPVYIPCASIIVLFFSGLTVDLVGPMVGVAEPLRTVPLLAGLETTCLALLAASANAPSNVAMQWRSLSRPSRFAGPLIIPMVSAAGALRLNSGHGNGVALVAACASVALLVASAVFSSRFDKNQLEVILFAAGLAIGWSYSLRGDGVYGFDIATEYQRLQQTILAGVWHAAHPNDAYGAMLSVTVMPTELHSLSGIPGLLVLKVVYPAIYALFPVAIFDLARRLLSRRWAFVAATFALGQYAFAEIPTVARQEIALVLFVALIMAMLDTRLQRYSQWALIALLGLAMALSHYSTTYVAITVIGLALVLQWVVSWFSKIPRVTGAMVVAFVASSAAAVIWYVPVTQSDSHLLQVAQTIEAQGLNLLPNRPPGGGLLAAYLEGNTKTAISAAEYAQLVHSYYFASEPFIAPLPNAGLPQYALRDSVVPEPTVKWHLGYDVLSLWFLVIEQIANVLAALGALMMILRRNSSLLTRQVGLLAVTTTLLLTVLRFSGTLAAAYGQERAQLQGLVLLAIALGWFMQDIASMRKVRLAPVLTVTVACLTVILVNTTYLVSAMLGGETSVNIANGGAAFEFFYTTAPELASAEWLGKAVRPGQLVYTDEYGQLPVAEMTGMQQGLFVDLTPLTLNDHAWVYASLTNVTDERAFGVFENHLATYVFPAEFLSENYDLVYTNGSSEVFHR
jgi:uncharacterized membrane protein